jgi:hypothetical protein
MQLGRASALAVGALLVSGCDFPTAAPILEHQWLVPVDRSTISVAELLPAGVSISGGAFLVRVDPIVSARTLGQLCSVCGPLQGRTVPVPPFTASFTSSTALPDDVVSAVLAGGAVQLSIRNGFSFNPLANGGELVVTLRDGASGRQLGRLELRGPADALPPGGFVTRAITLAPGSLGSTVTSVTELSVRAGSVARIDNSQEVRITATPSNVLISSARVNVGGEAVSFETVELDVEDLEDFESDIQEGAVVLEVTNPFGVAFSGQITLAYPGGTIRKSVTIGSGATSSVSIPFTVDELRAFLGTNPVHLSGSATVAGGAITITPQQVVEIDAKIRVTLRLGE